MAFEQTGFCTALCPEGVCKFIPAICTAILFFVYADEAFRRERAKTHYGSQSLKELEKENKTRERYYNYYTGQKWGDMQNYDLMINTSKLSPEAAVDLILGYIEKRDPK